jgi:AraC-like DNA-binding protein
MATPTGTDEVTEPRGRRPDAAPTLAAAPPLEAAEEEALRLLSLKDLAAARSSLRVIVSSLARSGRPRATHLLFDLLCRVDRTVTQHLDRPAPTIAERSQRIDHLHTARTEAEIVACFWSLYEAAIRPLLQSGPRCHPTVTRAKSFVEQNYMRKICLSHIAESVNMSRGYLSALFRNHCGVTLTEYIHRVRMREAERLLASGEHSISQVGYAVGYQNYRDFHRNFVRYEKVSPRTFLQEKGRPGRLPPVRLPLD